MQTAQGKEWCRAMSLLREGASEYLSKLPGNTRGEWCSICLWPGLIFQAGAADIGPWPYPIPTGFRVDCIHRDEVGGNSPYASLHSGTAILTDSYVGCTGQVGAPLALPTKRPAPLWPLGYKLFEAGIRTICVNIDKSQSKVGQYIKIPNQ